MQLSTICTQYTASLAGVAEVVNGDYQSAVVNVIVATQYSHCHQKVILEK